MQKNEADRGSPVQAEGSLARLQSAFAQLQATFEREQGQLEAEITRLEAERERLEGEVGQLKTVRVEWGSLIKLNVGGRTYTTSKTTLTRYEDSLLGRMFSGRHELATDDEGRVFIDRNGELFEHVLDFLREGTSWVAPEEQTLLLRLEKEFDYFQIPFNPDALSTSPSLALVVPAASAAEPEPTAIYVIGGRNDELRLTLGVVERYDPATNRWTTVGNLPAARNSAAAVALLGRVFVMGGLSADTSSVGFFKAGEASLAGWQALEGLSTVRNGLAGVTLAGRIYAVGGHNNAIYLSSVERYDARTNLWERVSELSTPRYALAAVALNGRIYAIGGHSGTVPLASVEVYDPVADAWRSGVVPDMPTARYYLSAAVVGGRIYALGGFGEACQAAVECYDPATNAWTSVAPLPAAKYALAAASLGGYLYALGGFDDKTTFATVDRYDPATNAWTRVADMPTAKYALASTAC